MIMDAQKSTSKTPLSGILDTGALVGRANTILAALDDGSRGLILEFKFLGIPFLSIVIKLTGLLK